MFVSAVVCFVCGVCLFARLLLFCFAWVVSRCCVVVVVVCVCVLSLLGFGSRAVACCCVLFVCVLSFSSFFNIYICVFMLFFCVRFASCCAV